MNNFLNDLRFGWRLFQKNPGFYLVIVFTLALGVSANTAIFSIFNTILLRPLPFKDSDRLVALWEIVPQFRGRTSSSVPNILDWKSQNTVFESMAAYNSDQVNFHDGGEPERIQSQQISEGYFSLLGIQPKLGRVFLPQEHGPGQTHQVILSHRFWQNRLGSKSNILGQTVRLDGAPHTVVGVMPELNTVDQPELWLPLYLDPASDRGNFALSVIGRLKPGVSLDRARAELSTISKRLEQQYPATNKGIGVQIVDLHADLFGESYQTIWTSFWTLMAAVGLVLLIGCTNIANLLLSHAGRRQREIAVRIALGAGRFQVVRQLLTENLWLSLAGGGLGLLQAHWACNLVNAYFVNVDMRWNVAIDGRVLIFTLIISLATAFVFGLVPALQVSKTNLNETLKEGGRSGSAGSSRHRLNRLLVISEVTLAMILLIAAGLVIKGFQGLIAIHPGFQRDNILTMNFSLAGDRYKAEQGRKNFYLQLLSRVSGLPGVQAAGLISHLPLSAGSNSVRAFTIEGRPAQAPGEALMENFQVASAHYLQTLGIPLKKGRFLTEQDLENAQPVMVVNESMAQKYWPNQDPIGKRLKLEGKLRTIVGVMADVRLFSLNDKANPQMYVPFTQYSPGDLALAIRTSQNPLGLVSLVKNEIRAIDATQPVSQVRTMEKVISDGIAGDQFLIYMMGLFATLALILAVVGLYSVMAYSVSQRTREFGVRMALGAQTRDVLKNVLHQGIILIFIGSSLGLIVSFGLMRGLASLLYGLSPTDPMTYGGVSLLLILVALTACYLPARRATKVDPLVALRYE